LLGERKGKSTRNLRTMNVLTALVWMPPPKCN
jgi:hypothetical protein